MKAALLSFFLFLPWLALGQEESSTPWEGEAITGPVAEVDYRAFQVFRSRSSPYEVIDKTWTVRQVFTYGRGGRVLSKVSYDREGGQTAHLTYLYDDQGRLLRETDLTRDIDGTGPESVYSTRDEHYDDDGFLDREEVRDGEGVLRSVRSLVRQDGRLVEDTLVRADGSLVVRKAWAFDADGRPVSLDEVREGYRERSLWSRGPEGGVLEVQRTGRDGQPGERVVKALDPWDRPVRGEGFQADGTPEGSVDYTYGDSPRWTEETFRLGTKEQARRTVFDEKGRVVEELSRDSEEGSARISLYGYDEDIEGNWVRRVRKDGIRPLDGGPDVVRTGEVILRLIRYDDSRE